MRLLVLAGATMAAGVTLLLGELPWWSRRRLVDRLRPYHVGAAPPGTHSRDASMRQVLAAASGEVATRLARLVGVEEPLAIRLERLHATTEPSDIRLRQLGWACGGLVLGGIATLVLAPPPTLALAMVLIPPVLAVLLVEQQLVSACERRRRRIEQELPTVAEILGMLLSSGYSLGAAIRRVSERSSGACAQDLQRVRARISQGVSERAALEEWAEITAVPGVARLVGVLQLGRETIDLGSLITDEARALRRDEYRRLLETIERRSQQVWIPVTVATLVPGVIFLAIPFVAALRLFAGG